MIDIIRYILYIIFGILILGTLPMYIWLSFVKKSSVAKYSFLFWAGCLFGLLGFIFGAKGIRSEETFGLYLFCGFISFFLCGIQLFLVVVFEIGDKIRKWHKR